MSQRIGGEAIGRPCGSRDRIEDDLDPGAMERLDHVTKLVQRAERVRPRAIAVVRREKRERLIPPVIAAKARWTILFVEGKDREKLDGGDAEILEIGNFLD